MQSNKRSITPYVFLATLALSFIYLGLVAHAQDKGLGINLKLDNPIASNTLPEFIVKVVNVVKLISIPIITIFVVYAGFLFVTARGDTKKIDEGKKALYGAVIGTAIILGATVLANVIQGTITKF